jgi:hypothetical protein
MLNGSLMRMSLLLGSMVISVGCKSPSPSLRIPWRMILSAASGWTWRDPDGMAASPSGSRTHQRIAIAVGSQPIILPCR